MTPALDWGLMVTIFCLLGLGRLLSRMEDKQLLSQKGFKSLKCIAATTMSLAVYKCSISTGRLAREEKMGAWPCDFKPFKAQTY